METTETNISKDDYVVFDATSIKQLLIRKLNEGGVYTDQNYEGSNFSSLISILSQLFHTLLYYQNQNATEVFITDASLYENINRLVKLIGYNPIGKTTATLSFELTAEDALGIGSYIIPRYSFFNVQGKSYAFASDVVVEKTVTEQEYLETLSESVLLFQGKFKKYPLYISNGNINQKIILSLKDTKIDHFNIHVYVYDTKTNKWDQYNRVDSLLLSKPTEKVFSIRINENKLYDITFGDGINGKKLNENDKVQIFYLESDGELGQISNNIIDGTKLTIYNEPTYNEILDDIKTQNITYFTPATYDPLFLSIKNTYPSSQYKDEESVDEIRDNSLKFKRVQNRLVTKDDYETYIKTKFSYAIQDVKVLTCDEYIDSHYAYFYKLGVTNVNEESRLFYNQIQTATNANFNNIYTYIVPRSEKITSNVSFSYISPATKTLIKNSINSIKCIGTELVFNDPVYLAVNIGIPKITDVPTYSDINNSKLVIYTKRKNAINSNIIKNSVVDIFINYFKTSNQKLGQTLEISELINQIMNLDNVSSISTKRTDTKYEIDGIFLNITNKIYPQTPISVNKDYIIEPFQFLYYENPNNLLNLIEVN